MFRYSDLIAESYKIIAKHCNAISGVVSVLLSIGAIFRGLEWPNIVLLAVGTYVATLYILKNIKLHNLKFPKADQRDDRHYNVLDTYFSKKSIRVMDFVDGAIPPLIKGKVFENCVIYGPCIFFL